MIPGVIAKRYATALLEIGNESGQLDAMVDEVARAAAAFDLSPELHKAFADPLVAEPAKMAILAEVCEKLQLGQVTKNVLAMLMQNFLHPIQFRTGRDLTHRFQNRRSRSQPHVTPDGFEIQPRIDQRSIEIKDDAAHRI